MSSGWLPPCEEAAGARPPGRGRGFCSSSRATRSPSGTASALQEALVVLLAVVLGVVEQVDLRVLLALRVQALAGHVGPHRRQQVDADGGDDELQGDDAAEQAPRPATTGASAVGRFAMPRRGRESSVDRQAVFYPSPRLSIALLRSRADTFVEAGNSVHLRKHRAPARLPREPTPSAGARAASRPRRLRSRSVLTGRHGRSCRPRCPRRARPRSPSRSPRSRASSCSTTITVLPASTSPSSCAISLSTSAGCSPVVGSSRT